MLQRTIIEAPTTNRAGRLWTGLGLGLSLFCFLVAALLSPVPSVDPTPSPAAQTVRLGRDSASQLAAVAFAGGSPRPVSFSAAQLDAMAVLANHGLGWLRWRPRLSDEALRVDASLRLGAAWLNARLHLAPSDREGFPRVGLQIGQLPVPEVLLRSLIDTVPALARVRGLAVPPPEAMLARFDVHRAGVAATVAVPQSVVRLGRSLLDPGGNRVDPRFVRSIYARLLTTEILRPHQRLDDVLRQAFAGQRQLQVDDLTHYNRAALIAVAMFVVDPATRRMTGHDAGPPAPCEPRPPYVTLAGRNDLAKHFALSAAMAGTLNPQFTRAIGEWKELDDSLPGGSGFSFVDLAADRAGLAIGRAATRSGSDAPVAALLARAREADIFPAAALGLAEGLSEADFRDRFGSLDDEMGYGQAVRRIDGLLAALPLFREHVGAAREAG